MFYAAYQKLFTRATYRRLPYVLKNALEEITVLHTRILWALLNFEWVM
jgi:hypothetical protein